MPINRFMKLILASTSPRRRHLLKETGFQFLVHKPKTDEIMQKGESPQKMVKRLSLEKAEAVALETQYTDCIILAADTTVVEPKNKKILNKPKSKIEAKKMLELISGKTHTVLTGFTLLHIQKGVVKKRISKVVKTKVKIRRMSKNLIIKYIETGEPMDKAGSYGAQAIGMHIIESIRGSYTNVVGLPMCEVTNELMNLGFYPVWYKKNEI